MHVCHFCDSSVEGDYFRNIVAGLTRKGVRVSLVELGNGRVPDWLAEIPTASYLCFAATSKIQYPFVLWRLVRLLKNEKVDILHTHLFYSGLLGVLTKWFHRKTIVALMRHHTSVVRMFGSRFHIAADKWMAEKADHVLVVSQAGCAYMRYVDGVKRDIDVVYLGFDFEELSPNAEVRKRVRREFALGDDDFVIGYVANFVRGKGHIQLIEAFEKIVIKIPNARLMFAGRGMLPEVERAAAKLPSGKVVFAGWRNDIPAFLNAMDLFVQPSLSEAFSQVLVEAMGVGLPVIATDVGGANEVITDGENGLLMEPDSPNEIYEKVTLLARNRELSKRMAKDGRRTVNERFTVEKMVDAQYELYKRWYHDGNLGG